MRVLKSRMHRRRNGSRDNRFDEHWVSVEMFLDWELWGVAVVHRGQRRWRGGCSCGAARAVQEEVVVVVEEEEEKEEEEQVEVEVE